MSLCRPGDREFITVDHAVFHMYTIFYWLIAELSLYNLPVSMLDILYSIIGDVCTAIINMLSTYVEICKAGTMGKCLVSQYIHLSRGNK